MTTLLNVVACGALSVVLASASTLVASPADGQAGSPPWVIANGQPDAGLYVPRDIQQAYAKGTRSPDGRPGPNYWQNHAEHRIHISLTPPSRRVTLRSVTLDTGIFVDANPGDNGWKADTAGNH